MIRNVRRLLTLNVILMFVILVVLITSCRRNAENQYLDGASAPRDMPSMRSHQSLNKTLAGDSANCTTMQTSGSFVGSLTRNWRSIADPKDPFNCTTGQIFNLTPIRICLYSVNEDRFISMEFSRGQYWSKKYVERLLLLLSRNPETTFVDLGANIGSFTLPAARLTSVVAAEPFSRSMARLAKAVELGGTSCNVTLVNNAISNRRGVFPLIVSSDNLGGNRLTKGEDTCENSSSVNCIHTILLDDLLPLMRTRNVIMKVDVESHEYEVFTEVTAGNFFAQLDVKLVLMEWENVSKRPAEQVTRLVTFFSNRKYIVVDPNKSSQTNQLLFSQFSSWPLDVLFVKDGFDALDPLYQPESRPTPILVSAEP